MNVDEIASQQGKTVVITGANSGLGFESAKFLAAKGATVVLACRDTSKAETATLEIRKATPDAKLEVLALDLSSLKSVENFAGIFSKKYASLDVLLNNAGLMAIPRRLTADGFEMQLGTNHLGHFALTMHLLPLLEKAQAPRIVSVSSLAHRFGKMNFDDLMGAQTYSAWPAYGQSKLANLLFTFELERRLRRSQKRSIAVGAHPGYASTNLQSVAAKMNNSTLVEKIMDVGNSLVAQSAAQGAAPQLCAGFHQDVSGADFFGPDGLFEMRGSPTRVGTHKKAKNETDAQKLFEVSERLTGLQFI
jgi:NAD(P)-dependent dehydrogenase (short-subunit alcohol dehydrogenase family)